MLPWEKLDEAALPDGSGTLQLVRRGTEYVIRVDGRDLMGSREHGSEEVLAELACESLGSGASVLVGGLGMGFTLAATLKSVASDAKVTVVELVQTVVDWNEGVLADLAGEPLKDERVDLQVADVCKVLRESTECFDVILLDVDNGPDGLTRESNNWLYQQAGLRASFKALRPGGVLGIWSAFDDQHFTQRLRAAGFHVEVQRVRARGRKGSRHVIWLARRR